MAIAVALFLMICSLSAALLSHHQFFLFHVTATTDIYTLSLHDALPICLHGNPFSAIQQRRSMTSVAYRIAEDRSEEHTSELQSLRHLVCRLLLEKKKNL